MASGSIRQMGSYYFSPQSDLKTTGLGLFLNSGCYLECQEEEESGYSVFLLLTALSDSPFPTRETQTVYLDIKSSPLLVVPQFPSKSKLMLRPAFSFLLAIASTSDKITMVEGIHFQLVPLCPAVY